MNEYAVGTDTSELEKPLRKHKKELRWIENNKVHRWNSEEAKIANRKGHHWDSYEAKLAVKKRWKK